MDNYSNYGDFESQNTCAVGFQNRSKQSEHGDGRVEQYGKDSRKYIF